MSNHTSNPQPQAVKRIDENINKDKPSNLNGSEMGKKPSIKEKKVKERGACCIKSKCYSKGERLPHNGCYPTETLCYKIPFINILSG